jgi:prepilin-type N-terminal cleavage/methylation domain-containing protein
MRVIPLTARNGRTDHGVTLLEVLIAIVISGIIMIPLANTLLNFIDSTDETTNRLAESHDVQIAAAYFAQDVQSLGARDWDSWPYPLQQSVELDAPATGGLYPCGELATPDAVVRLAWDDPQDATSAPAVVRVAYVVVVTATERQLHRITCVDSATPVADIVVVHNLDPTDPVVICSSACTGAPAVPAWITLRLTIRSAGSSGTAVVVDLTGQRRQT